MANPKRVGFEAVADMEQFERGMKEYTRGMAEVLPDTGTSVLPDRGVRALLMTVREALLLIVTGIERYLGMPRTKEARHKT